MDGIESPVTGVTPKSDSPKVSRVRVFRDSFQPAFNEANHEMGKSISEDPSYQYQAFSIDEKGNPIGHAEASVEGAYTTTIWHPNHLGDHQVPDDEGYVQDGKERRPASAYERRLKNDEHYKKTGQPPLFYVEGEPATFSMLFSTPENSSGLPSYLLGAIGKQFRGDLTYDENLTPHSAKIVHRAGKLGLVKENPRFNFKQVAELAFHPYPQVQDDRSTQSRSLINNLRSATDERALENDEAYDDKELKEALNLHLNTAKYLLSELPKDEVNELPNVLKDAIKTAKAEKAAAVAQPAVTKTSQEDNTKDVPLPGFEEK